MREKKFGKRKKEKEKEKEKEQEKKEYEDDEGGVKKTVDFFSSVHLSLSLFAPLTWLLVCLL